MEDVTQKEIDEGKSLAWLSYLGILFLVPLLAMGENRYAKFHAKQGMVLFAASLLLAVVFCVLNVVVGILLNRVPSGDAVSFCWTAVSWLIWLVVLAGPTVLAIIGIVKAVSGEMWRMPVLGGIARKF